MEEGARNGGFSDGLVKSRNSTGCLIIKKKADGGGYSGPDIVYKRKEKKRPRVVESDSESSDDQPLEFYGRRSGSKQVSGSSGSLVYKKKVVKESNSGRSKGVNFARNEVFPEERKRNTLDVYDFDEYDDLDDVNKGYFDTHGSGRMFAGMKPAMRSEVRGVPETGSSRHAMLSDRKRPSLESTSSEKIGGNSPVNGRFDIKSKLPIQALKGNFESCSDEAIRLQGKNGVLKLMVKNKKAHGPSKVQNYEEVEGSSVSISRESTPKNAMMHHSVHLKNDKMKPRKLLQSKGSEDSDEQLEESEELPRMPSNDAKTRQPTKRERNEAGVTPSPKRLQASRLQSKVKRGSDTESKVKRGSGTEKQLLREKIRSMLVSAGWTIDYRPRRNRDYFDAVYINPAGTAYWSIIKAYDAFQKQLEEEGTKADGDCSTINLISDDVLSKLTRQTQKKLEKELKRKKREDRRTTRKKKAATDKFVDDDSETDSSDSVSDEEKLSSFIKQRGISKVKSREVWNENGNRQAGRMQERTEKPSAASSHVHGRKTKKIGRCTLLVRNADKGLNSEGDGFVPYKGKRTLLSWLIDSGTVKLSEKVLYMNRRRTRVMLEGWVTRDGIHCGCCSKILTVSKFEMHAASKLRQPYQSIFLISGVSLLECQVDAWNSQDDPQRRGFHMIDVDGDDPNDDTCGICGDGGNLICCDGCPSTFHQNCVGIEMLPSGDWHCPHCSCKFCGLTNVDKSQKNESTSNELDECNLCERKYHKSCIQEENTFSNSSNNQISFCGRKCQELFKKLQKLVGVKHELESGLSWSLIHRTDLDFDPSHRGFSQKVEWNAKLAVASQVMDECFLPITDRRSGINLIQNVLYNCRSNFNRLNYGGFYTAILERGDEIICAASIRIHGTQLAEMPFIGTRHIYRRQGMCRRLLLAIESALRSLKVEKLIIPAISDMMDTWTIVFGFSALEEPDKREMKALNMLVFPGTDMLQKQLVEHGSSKRETTAGKVTDLCKDDGGYSPLPDLTKGSDMETSPSEASVSDPLTHGDMLIVKSDAPQKSDAGFSLQESAVSLNAAASLPSSTFDDPSKERNDSLDAKSSLMDNPIKHNLHASREGAEIDRHEKKVASPHSGSEAVDGSIVGTPVLDSPTKNNVQAIEVDIDAPSETNDKTTGAGSALKDIATSLMIHPRLEDTNESEPLTRSANLDSAAEHSAQPHLKNELEAPTRLICSDVSPKPQNEEAKPDSSALNNNQLHMEGEMCVALEAKAADTSSFSEAAGFSSNGTSISVPCSNNTHKPEPHALKAVAHCETEQQSGESVPDLKLISLPSANHECLGLQTPHSDSCIRGNKLDPLENGVDNIHENNEVAGTGPGCNSLGEGFTQISEC